jgi:hypothetical protein
MLFTQSIEKLDNIHFALKIDGLLSNGINGMEE